MNAVPMNALATLRRNPFLLDHVKTFAESSPDYFRWCVGRERTDRVARDYLDDYEPTSRKVADAHASRRAGLGWRGVLKRSVLPTIAGIFTGAVGSVIAHACITPSASSPAYLWTKTDRTLFAFIPSVLVFLTGFVLPNKLQPNKSANILSNPAFPSAISVGVGSAGLFALTEQGLPPFSAGFGAVVMATAATFVYSVIGQTILNRRARLQMQELQACLNLVGSAGLVTLIDELRSDPVLKEKFEEYVKGWVENADHQKTLLGLLSDEVPAEVTSEV